VVLVSPRDGGTVIIAGASAGNGTNDLVSVAYSVATGRTKWVSRVHRAFQPEFLDAPAISHDGRTFYLTGSVLPGGGGGEEPSDAIAVSPDSAAVYNVVQNFTTSPADFSTIAFRA
jgi:hypothetical protein